MKPKPRTVGSEAGVKWVCGHQRNPIPISNPPSPISGLCWSGARIISCNIVLCAICSHLPPDFACSRPDALRPPGKDSSQMRGGYQWPIWLLINLEAFFCTLIMQQLRDIYTQKHPKLQISTSPPCRWFPSKSLALSPVCLNEVAPRPV